MRAVDLLVFDLDGTLVRSVDDLAAGVNHALKMLGRPIHTLETIRGFIGDGIPVLMKRALDPCADANFARSMDLFTDYYAEHLLDHTTLYPDVPAILDHFDQKKKVIVTNKAQEFAVKIIGEGSVPFKKPDPRLLQIVMTKWGATPERTVVIGDGINDILLARQSGALCCAFLNGITGREKLLELAPDMTFEALSELMSLLC
jgi:phosphoglycolate phosphatase